MTKQQDALDAPEEIYLLHGYGDGGETVWCDHLPDLHMDATLYIRADLPDVCELCKGDEDICAELPNIRHCPKANGEQVDISKPAYNPVDVDSAALSKDKGWT